MADNNTHKYKKDVLRLATFIGQLMLRNGAETYRVDDTIKRICSSRGFTHINIFMAPNTIIVSDDRFDGYILFYIIIILLPPIRRYISSNCLSSMAP